MTNNLDRMFTRDPVAFAGAYLQHFQHILTLLDLPAIGRFAEMLLDARARGATVYFAGNGGSAATASHFANDLAIGTRDLTKPFRVVSLADNVPVMTAIANDFGYDQVFSRQLRVLMKPGDVLVVISASGNSPNLLEAIAAARDTGGAVFTLTAFDGGKMRGLGDDGIHVPTELQEYGPAEDTHIVVNHLVNAYLMRFVRAE